MRKVPDTFSTVLVVGAGTLGQIFGAHLSLHGVDVAFLVRSKNSVPKKIRMRAKASRNETVIQMPEVLDAATLKEKKYDAIFIATRTEDLKAVLKTISILPLKDIPVFFLCPIWSDEQIPGHDKMGNLYYLMPGIAAMPDDGVQVYKNATSRLGPIGDSELKTAKDMAFLLTASGLPCRFDKKLMKKILQPSMAVIVLFALIEIYQGKFSKMTLTSESLKSGMSGLKEAIGAMGRVWGVHNVTLEALFKLPNPVLRFLVWAVVKVLPRFYREMLSLHAGKISAQTLLMLDEAVRELSRKEKIAEFEKFVLLLKKKRGDKQ